MSMYPGPSCPDCPFSTELGNVEINTRIQGVLACGVDLNFGSSLVPLRECVDSPWLSLLEFTFVYLYQFLLLNACTFLRRVLGMHSTPLGGEGVTLPEDVVRREANHTHGERLWVRRQRRRERRRTLPLSPNPREVTMKRGMKTGKRGR
jgi:hypothetical protein